VDPDDSSAVEASVGTSVVAAGGSLAADVSVGFPAVAEVDSDNDSEPPEQDATTSALQIEAAMISLRLTERTASVLITCSVRAMSRQYRPLKADA
jgi:hypothetical protein